MSNNNYHDFSISSGPDVGTYTVSEICMKTFPCQHNVIIYKNGKISEERMFKGAITNLMEQGNRIVESHFKINKYFEDFTISNGSDAGTYTVSTMCMESLPCQHNVMIYKNGKISNVIMFNNQIGLLMKKGNKEVPLHFYKRT